MAKVLISVLSWHAPEYLENLFRNLLTMAPALRHEAHVHVLDQGSGTAVQDLIRSYLGRIPFLSAELGAGNLGFGPGHNRVFEHFRRHMDFEHFLILNQDVVFGVPGWVDMLMAAMAQPDVAIAGPVAHGIDFQARIFRRLSPQDIAARPPLFIEGSIALIRRRDIEALGLFDEDYVPAYFEDSDLGRRYAACGRRVAVVPVPHAHNYLGRLPRLGEEPRSYPFAQEIFAANRERFYTRWSQAGPLTAKEIPLRFPKTYLPRAIG